MKLCFILMIISLLQLSATVYSQNAIITIDGQATISEVFAAIEKQTEYKVFYKNDQLDVNLAASIGSGQIMVKDALSQILNKSDCSYTMFDRLIVITPKSEASQQSIPITGMVTDEAGEPMPGVNVVVKGTTTGVVTDIDGKYSLTVPGRDAVLVLSFIGYITQELAIGDRTVINVSLQENIKEIEEVVVVGYGTVKKRDLTGSIHHVNADNFKNQSVTQITDILAGTVAGFYSQQGSSASGGGTMEIRGRTSLTASTEPLIVLDGAIFMGSIRDINPNDIESIDILKDASSAAVYGAKAAAGVVIINTIKGAKTKPIINFSAKVGVAESYNKRRGFGPEQFIKFRQDWFRTTTNDPYDYYTHPNKLPDNISIEEWRAMNSNPINDDTREWMQRLKFYDIEQKNYLAGKTVDWYDKVVRNGLRQDYDLSIGGGSDNFNYYWSLGYNDNEGLYVGDEYASIRSRMNVDFKVNNWLNVGVNAQFSDRDESGVPAIRGSGSFYPNSPFGQMFDDEGNLERMPHGHTNNPLLDHYRTTKLKKINNLFANMYADVALPAGFSFRISYQPRYENFKDYQFVSKDKRVGGDPLSDTDKGYRYEYSEFGWMMDNILKWNKRVGVHNFDVTLLFNVEERKRWRSEHENINFSPSEELGFHALQYGDNPTVFDDDWRETGNALMARLNYTLLDKYLFTASVRRDGYSAFGQEHPTATFPAFAFAWRLSEENFFNVNAVNNLKLRLSWGANGNRSIGRYAALATMESAVWYDGSGMRIGMYNSTLANKDLRWERTEAFNVGLDVGLFNYRIDLSLDFYNMTTTDLLMERTLPPVTGYSDIMANLGELGNVGFETTIKTLNINREKISWNSSLVFSMNRNKIKKLFGDMGEFTLLGKTQYGELPDYTNKWFPGQSIDVVWDYDRTGIWQEHEKEEATKYNMRPGDFKSDDPNDDGKYTAMEDKKFIGHTTPRFRIGFGNEVTFLKHFTASLFIRADLGHIGLYNQALNGGSENNDRRNRSQGPIPYWMPDNPINDYARLDVNTAGYGGGLNFYMPQWFVRIQDFSIAYNMPEAIAQKLRLDNVRIFASIRNLATFTDWPDWDPETSGVPKVTGNNPMPRIFTIGINLSL